MYPDKLHCVPSSPHAHYACTLHQMVLHMYIYTHECMYVQYMYINYMYNTRVWLRTPKSCYRVLSRKIANFDILRNLWDFLQLFRFSATLIIYPNFLGFPWIYTFLLYTGRNYLTDIEWLSVSSSVLNIFRLFLLNYLCFLYIVHL